MYKKRWMATKTPNNNQVVEDEMRYSIISWMGLGVAVAGIKEDRQDKEEEGTCIGEQDVIVQEEELVVDVVMEKLITSNGAEEILAGLSSMNL